MAEIKDNDLIITDDEGKEYLKKILFTYENEQRGHKYVFFYDPANEEEVLVMIYTDSGELLEIEDDEEYQETQEVFETYMDELNK